ncbi:hypothetical protein TNCV_548481 [Trichonephila clavipes]|nr:hypothetical protein TNCV_548481 [Trichonephila clavipes]
MKINVALYSYTRAFGNGPHKFKPWSSDEDDNSAGIPSPNYNTNGRTFELSTDLRCIAPHRIFSGIGFKLMTCQPGSDTLTTKLLRPR